MIFVTLGTQDKSFERLLELLEKEIKKKKITQEVVVQAGCTKFSSQYMQVLDYVSEDQFEKYIEDCSFLITHGGVGSIFTGLKHHKKILVMPRLAKYKEHHNDHQLEITEEFTKEGYILSFQDEKSFEKALKELPRFSPRQYKSNTPNMIHLIENFIEGRK